LVVQILRLNCKKEREKLKPIGLKEIIPKDLNLRIILMHIWPKCGKQLREQRDL